MNQRKVILETKNLMVGYGSENVLLKDVNLKIYSGEIFMILGGSGVGKTTLLHNLVGLRYPLAGEINVLGKNLDVITENEKSLLLQKVGVTYQRGALFSSLTVAENLALQLREFAQLPEPIIQQMCKLKLKLVALDGFADYMPDQLSGGMIKRVAIARALMLDPSIILFDEPGSGLDPLLAHNLDMLIKNLVKTLGVTFVIISHDLHSVFKIADRVALLNKEQKGISYIGKPKDSQELIQMNKSLTTTDNNV